MFLASTKPEDGDPLLSNSLFFYIHSLSSRCCHCSNNWSMWCRVNHQITLLVLLHASLHLMFLGNSMLRHDQLTCTASSGFSISARLGSHAMLASHAGRITCNAVLNDGEGVLDRLASPTCKPTVPQLGALSFRSRSMVMSGR